MDRIPLKALLSISILALFLSTPLSAIAESLVYREGDWASYKLTINMGGVECVYRVRLSVKSVNDTVVRYSLALEEVVKQDEQKCQLAATLLMLGLAFSSNIERNVSSLTPESRELLINPSYTGEYTVSNGFKTSYVKGVLTLLEGESTDIIVTRIKVELVDTSISMVKPYQQAPLLLIAGLMVAAVVTTLVLITRRLRRERTSPETGVTSSVNPSILPLFSTYLIER
ncbi:MAG: hypothetical protein QW182_05240 [Thermosphaera sp.]